MTAWSRKQFAKAAAKLEAAYEILDEIWKDDSRAFANRPVGWQRSAEGEAEQARLSGLDNLIQQLHDASEEVGAMNCRPDYPPTTTAANPPTAPPQRYAPPLPLLLASRPHR
jgi:hypothetical protein